MTKPPLGSSLTRRSGLAACAVAALLAFAPTASAQQIIPSNFFSLVPTSFGGQMAVSADTMVFNQNTATVVAQGNVGISFQGYSATADRAIYSQRSGRVELVGNVAFVDPDGIEYVADRVELEDGFKEGFLEALTVAFPDGTWFSAAQTSFDEGVERVYTEGLYAPCGSCIDAEGRTIGWTVKAARIVTDEETQIIYFEQPSLQLLGHSVLWLPSLTLPQDSDIEMPVLSYDEQYGIGISLPFFNYPIANGNLAVTPAIYTNQGAGVTLDWTQRVGDLSYRVTGSGVVQLNPDAYTGLANRTFRGALQTTGTFTPTEEWTLGWSATVFTDPGYLPDYRVARRSSTNEVYARYLDPDTYADIRIEQHNPLGNQPNWAAQQALMDRQALTLPNARAEHTIDLDEAGRVTLAGKLLGLRRAADHQSGVFDGDRYVFGYEGQSVHAMMQASWINQYIAPGGIAVSPYLGARTDLAYFDGASGLPSAPAEQSLFSLTPIAALDVRYPLMARTAGASHVIEPIAQLVYRDGPTTPGIINNDSQSFVVGDTNLFSFNRFSGADRQETGLRANVGGQLQTSFDNGGWLSALVGQSFHLAQTNSFAVADGSPAGIGSGMDADTSYVVAGLQGGMGGLSGGANVQLDPASGEIPRTLVSARASVDGYAFDADYVYTAANDALGTTEDRHEVGVGATIPLMDYWSAKAGIAWDIASNQWLETSGALEYDDKYLAFGVGTRLTGPTHRTPNDFRVGINFRLRRGGGVEAVGLDYAFDNDF